MSWSSTWPLTRSTDALGIGDAYREATGNSCFTAETHTVYEREVRLGDRLLVRTWLLGSDTKRLHYFHEMFHAESGERSAAQELMALHIDMRVRRVAEFPPDRTRRCRSQRANTHRRPCRKAPDEGSRCRISLCVSNTCSPYTCHLRGSPSPRW